MEGQACPRPERNRLPAGGDAVAKAEVLRRRLWLKAQANAKIYADDEALVARSTGARDRGAAGPLLTGSA